MKSVTVGQLRQNPTAALADVEAGATYRITRHDRVVGRLVPPGDEAVVIPPKRSSGAQTARLPRIELTTARTVDELLEDVRGPW